MSTKIASFTLKKKRIRQKGLKWSSAERKSEREIDVQREREGGRKRHRDKSGNTNAPKREPIEIVL